MTQSPIVDYLQSLHRTYASLCEGDTASYIPELAKANPDWFGICLVTTDGHIYEVGDSEVPFTIQSISKPFVYGLALEENSRAHLMTKVGVEPTGDAFNSISLDPVTGRPRNPMINAGAIATTGQISGRSFVARWERILRMFSLYAGRELNLDEAVYRSESETGHRNRAIGHMLRNFDILTEEPTPIVDLYFKQCSISVTARDLATMAATLANGGINPATGKQALRGEYVENVLSVMGTCGMYDFAGEWLSKVGLPAKSGVSGGIIAVLPGQLGIGVYSPRVDSHGNSLRGIRVCDDLSRYFNLHLFNTPTAIHSVIRLKYDAARVSSNRVRTEAERRILREHGQGIRVYQLQGNLTFARAERVVREVSADRSGTDALILDLKRVVTLNEPAARLFHHLVESFGELGKPILFTHASAHQAMRRFMKVKLGERFAALFRTVVDNDLALEWCENRLLAQHHAADSEDREVQPHEYELLAGLTAEEIAHVVPQLERRRFPAGATIIEAGTPAREFFLLARGRVRVVLTLPSGAEVRLATLSPGMVFGEMAALDGSVRSAAVIADEDVDCDLFPVVAFEQLSETHPHTKIKLLKNFSLMFCQRLRQANQELSVFG